MNTYFFFLHDVLQTDIKMETKLISCSAQYDSTKKQENKSYNLNDQLNDAFTQFTYKFYSIFKLFWSKCICPGYYRLCDPHTPKDAMVSDNEFLCLRVYSGFNSYLWIWISYFVFCKNKILSVIKTWH